jgi:intein-encoded DNA endonuclease-like protein
MNDGVKFSAGYVCGVICSDARIVWDEKHSNYYIMLETMNSEFAEMFYENIAKLVEKEPRTGTHKREKNRQIIHMKTVTVYGRGSVEAFVNKWGVSYGRRNWSVPDMAWNDDVFRKGFLMGFFDGNGSVCVSIENRGDKKTKKRSLKLHSVNSCGLNEIRKLLENEGIKSMIIQSGGCYTIKISGKTRLEVFRNRIGFGLSNKRDLLDNALIPHSISGYEENV